MSSSSTGWSESVRQALLWASAISSIDGTDQPVTANELFLGLLLAHPDDKGEVWQFPDHFGLTARDVLPDDYPVIDRAVLEQAARAARGPDRSDWDADV